MIARAMKDFLFPLLGFQFLATAISENNPLWERLLEKWGIGFIGIGLLYLLARWTASREAIVQKERQKREDLMAAEHARLEKERVDRETASAAERAELLKRNNELQLEMINNMNAHAARLENLTKEGTRAINDSGAAMRMMVRKMKRPCVVPFELPEKDESDS